MAFSKFPAAALLEVGLGKSFYLPGLPFATAGNGGHCRERCPVAWQALLPVPCGIRCPRRSTWASSQVVGGVGGEGMQRMLVDTPARIHLSLSSVPAPRVPQTPPQASGLR